MCLKRCKIVLVAFVSVVFGAKVFGWDVDDTSGFRSVQYDMNIVSYNTQNTLDTINDGNFPTSSKHYYYNKLSNITRVVAAITEQINQPPDIVALLEVQTPQTVEHLTQRTALRSLNYRYIITSSPDLRGMNIALLYQPHTFKPYVIRQIVVPSERHKLPPTRNILYTAGTIPNGEQLHILVVHLPSQVGNRRKKQKLRELALQSLRQTTDSILNQDPDSKIVVLGDFNVTPDDKLLKGLLHQQLVECPLENNDLVQGTYRFRGMWQMLDNIFTTGNMLLTYPHTTVRNLRYASLNPLSIISSSFLLTTSSQYLGLQPAVSTKYNNNPSDHLPLLLQLTYNMP